MTDTQAPDVREIADNHPLDQEFVDGYCDGHSLDNPEPSGNRHPAYRHSFDVARAELAGKPIAASLSRERVRTLLADAAEGVASPRHAAH